MNIQKILVPVDGSTASFEAFMWACELASRFQAQVHMVYWHGKWRGGSP